MVSQPGTTHRPSTASGVCSPYKPHGSISEGADGGKENQDTLVERTDPPGNLLREDFGMWETYFEGGIRKPSLLMEKSSKVNEKEA